MKFHATLTTTLALLFILMSVYNLAQAAKSESNEPAPAKTRINGYLGNKIDLCIHNSIAAQNPDELVAPFRVRTETQFWQSEFWGKWALSAVDAYRYTQNPLIKAQLDHAVTGLLATQTPDGYIGNYADDAHLQSWDIWGRKYCILGLLDYYDMTGDKKALQAARGIADHLLTEVGPGKANIVKTGNYRGMASSSILEPMVLLYNRTRDKRYLAFAEYIVTQWETSDGPKLISKALAGENVAERFPAPEVWWSWDNGKKAYEMMSCYDGLLELYKITGNADYLKAVQMTVQNIIDTEITCIGAGASVECWYGGKTNQTRLAKHTHETCITQTWMKLLNKLYLLTGDSGYMDQYEITMYNVLLGALTPDGSTFTKYSPLAGIRRMGELQCGMNLNCCSANGPRAMASIPKAAVVRNNDHIIINLYGEMESDCKLDAVRNVHISMKSEYPKSGLVNIYVTPAKKASFTVKLRQPGWAPSPVVYLNNEKIPASAESGYISLTREWGANDAIRLEFDMTPVVHRDNPVNPASIYLTTGPVVLARDERLDDCDVDELVEPVTEPDGNMVYKPVTTSAPVWIALEMPFITGDNREVEYGLPRGLVFCDYASAGNTWNKDSRFRVWLPQVLDPAK